MRLMLINCSISRFNKCDRVSKNQTCPHKLHLVLVVKEVLLGLKDPPLISACMVKIVFYHDYRARVIIKKLFVC